MPSASGRGNDLVQHRLKLLLVVGGLHHIGGHHQQAARGHHRLRVVALFETAARHRHDTRLFVGQIDLVGGQRTFHRRLRRLATGLLARRCGLCFPRRELRLMLGLLPLEPLLGTRLDRRTGCCQLLQSLLAPCQFLRERHAVGNIRLIRRLGLRQQVRHLGLQLRLDLARVLIGQRAVAAGIGVDLGAVQRHRAHLQHRPSRAPAAAPGQTAPRSP